MPRSDRLGIRAQHPSCQGLHSDRPTTISNLVPPRPLHVPTQVHETQLGLYFGPSDSTGPLLRGHCLGVAAVDLLRGASACRRQLLLHLAELAAVLALPRLELDGVLVVLLGLC